MKGHDRKVPDDSARNAAHTDPDTASDLFRTDLPDETGSADPDLPTDAVRNDLAAVPETDGSQPAPTDAVAPADGTEPTSDAADEKQPKRRPAFVRWLAQWAHRWFIDAFNGMAQGLFATLIVGTIVNMIGKWIGYGSSAFAKGLSSLLTTAGGVASALMGAGIGAGVAHALKAHKLVIFSAMIAGLIGAKSSSFLDGAFAFAGPGNPVGAYLAAIVGTEVCKLITGKTKVDIIALPMCMIAVALLMAYPVRYAVDPVIAAIGSALQWATASAPFVMGIVLSVAVGILLTMPTSSAAICVSIGLGGIAGGAAVAGCCAHMIGFAVASFRENKAAGLVAQGLGTSMLQIPNIMKRPLIMVPEIVASAIVGPLSTCVFGLQCSAAGSGMGTAGLVGVIDAIETSLSAGVAGWAVGLGAALLYFVIPAAVSLGLTELLRRFGKIREGDLKLDL